MNIAVVAGTLSGPPHTRDLPSGDVVANLDVTVSRATGPADTVPVAVFDPGRRVLALDAGADVVVVGRVRRRFYRASGATASRTEVVAERVVPAGRRTEVHRALGRVATDLGSFGADAAPGLPSRSA